MLGSVLQRADKRLILRDIIGLVSQILAQGCDFVAPGIMNDNTVAGWPGIAAGPSVGVCDEVVFWRRFHFSASCRKPGSEACGKIGGEDFLLRGRSEERRVGKECRSRWS